MQCIERMPHKQMRTTLHGKLMNYNKIIHFLKTAKHLDHWMPDINKLYEVITSSMTHDLRARRKETVQYQLSLGQKMGG